MTDQPRDPNFIRSSVCSNGLSFVEALHNDVVSLEGFPFDKENRNLCRLPERILPDISELGRWVCHHPSGGVLRFRTNSPRIVVRTSFTTNETSEWAPAVALFGFDAYVRRGAKREFVKTMYNLDTSLAFEDGLDNLDPRLREWTIYFPLRNHCNSLQLGLTSDARLLPARPQRIAKPILFYGSSIVEGGCASRPGLTYPAQIGRMLDAPIINWGFGGSGLGEQVVAKAIAELDLAALVIDYDHNAPSAQHLKQTHFPFYDAIRQRRPDLPILIASSVNYHAAPEHWGERCAIIEATYTKAKSRGDARVRFIKGRSVFPKSHWAECACDHVHPNDLGFHYMATRFGDALAAMTS